MNNVLQNLADGVSVCNVPAQLDASVVAALANAVTTQKTVTRIGDPVVGSTIDLDSLSSANENVTEFVFTNDTLVPITYWFTTLFMRAGQPADYGITNSAVDFPLAHGSDTAAWSAGNDTPNGGADLRRFNNFIADYGSAIIGRIEIQTPLAGTQSTQKLLTRNDNITGNVCSSNRIAPLCTDCVNNNTTTFVATFRCPQPEGMGHSFGYTVLPTVTVTMRVTTIGLPVADYQTLGLGDCGC